MVCIDLISPDVPSRILRAPQPRRVPVGKSGVDWDRIVQRWMVGDCRAVRSSAYVCCPGMLEERFVTVAWCVTRRVWRVGEVKSALWRV